MRGATKAGAGTPPGWAGARTRHRGIGLRGPRPGFGVLLALTGALALPFAILSGGESAVSLARALGAGLAACLAVGIALSGRLAKTRAEGGGVGARAAFLETIERRIAGEAGRPYSLVLFDIDDFKILNDRHGPLGGDAILTQTQRRLRSALPEGAALARFGSDEFLAFLPHMPSDEAQREIDALLQVFGRRPMRLAGVRVGVTLNAAIAGYPDTAPSLHDAISQVTSTLITLKRQGRNRSALARASHPGVCRLGSEVEWALSEGRLRAAYQPIMDLKTGHPVAEEGLARLVLRDGRVLDADQFISAASEFRLTSRIDREVIAQIVARCRMRSRAGDDRLRFMNVSAALLRERRSLEDIASVLTSCEGLGDLLGAPNPLVVEITERELVHEPQKALEDLKPLLELGVRLAIDDFGSGYSSFLYLTSLPVAFLKIEMRLLQAARTSARARSILKGIRAIAGDLGILTIAEGIEDEALAGLAGDLGMDWGQGFYYGRAAFDDPRGPRARAV